MINAGGVFALAYLIGGGITAATVNYVLPGNSEMPPEPDWFVVILAWPVLVLVLALMLLLGVVLPAWGEIRR